MAGAGDQSPADVLPTPYLPRDAFFAEGGAARDVGCEWKGKATYYDLVTEKRIAPKAAWSYLNPSPGFEPIAGAVAVMAALIDRCAVNGEKVLFQDTVVGGPVAFFSSDQTPRPDKLWRVVGSTPGGHHCDGFGCLRSSCSWRITTAIAAA